MKNLGLLSESSLRKFQFTGCEMRQAAGRVDALATRPYRSRRSMTSRPAELRTISSALPQALPSEHTKIRIDHARLAILYPAFIKMFIYRLHTNILQTEPLPTASKSHRKAYGHDCSII